MVVAGGGLLFQSGPATQAGAPWPTYLSVSAGAGHTCAIQQDQTVVCWGLDSTGQASPPEGTFKQLSSGLHYTCGIRTDDTMACWGQPQTDGPFGTNDFGQADAQPGTYLSVNAGRSDSCAIRTDGSLLCWGLFYGFIGGQEPPGQYDAVSVSDYFACALRVDQRIVCWGAAGAPWELGELDGQFSAMETGDGHVCGLRLNGTVECWGQDRSGSSQLPGTYSDLSLSDDVTCGLHPDGITCSGYNGYQGHSFGTTDPLYGEFTQVSVGTAHKCALRVDGTISCTGVNDYFEAPDIVITQEVASTANLLQGADFWFAAGGGSPPYEFRVVSGALPEGLALNTDGTVSGVAQSDAPALVVVQAIDVHGMSDVRQFWFNAYTTYLPRIYRDAYPW
jgi:alpha-tubulin suppressor-like RCC1 family protein